METNDFLKIIWEHLKAVVTGMAKHTLNSMATGIWQPFFSKFARFIQKFTCWIVVLYRGFFLSQIYIWSLLTNSRKRRRESRKKKNWSTQEKPSGARERTHNLSNLRWYFVWCFKKKKKDTTVSYWWHVMSNNAGCTSEHYISLSHLWLHKRHWPMVHPRHQIHKL